MLLEFAMSAVDGLRIRRVTFSLVFGCGLGGFRLVYSLDLYLRRRGNRFGDGFQQIADALAVFGTDEPAANSIKIQKRQCTTSVVP